MSQPQSEIDLYFAPTGNGYRAAIALEACQIPHRRIVVNIEGGKHKTPEFLILNPLGAIPVIVDHNGPGGHPLVLSQSGAILLHAAEGSGRFIPTDPRDRLRALQWFMAATSDAAVGNTLTRYIKFNAPDKSEANDAYFLERLRVLFEAFDRQIGSNEFIAGELSIADLALYPVINMRLDLVESAKLNSLRAWFDRLSRYEPIVRTYNAA
ncbi:glutathione S-transferase family protein [Hyphomicrobium sp.]|uniref:glutathione S-transferase family protein n=1 Tax=Hyphomicrobium sp. TaxID=82 RepID=UPI002FE28765